MRTQRTQDGNRARTKITRGPRRRPRGASDDLDPSGLSPMQILSTVCGLFCKGKTASEIVQIMKTDHNVIMSREKPYQYISQAASKGWIHFDAPRDHEIREKLEDSYPWLKGNVEVVHTAILDDVARRAAKMLLGLICQHHQKNPQRNEVHVGISGGYSIRRLGQALGDLLQTATAQLPRQIYFHGLVTGSHFEPLAEPVAIFPYIDREERAAVQTNFVALQAPAIVHKEAIEGLMDLEPTREAHERVKEIDIFVTSGALWEHEHSVLWRYMTQSPQSVKVLEAAGVVADLLWQPIGPKGPIEEETDIRALTLVELRELTEFIHQGKSVLLLLGPCAQCHQSKALILQTLLDLDPAHRLISHVVTDSLAAAMVTKEVERRRMSR